MGVDIFDLGVSQLMGSSKHRFLLNKKCFKIKKKLIGKKKVL